MKYGMTEDELKDIKTSSLPELKEALLEFGIPEGLILDFGQELCLITDISQTLSRTAAGVWKFTDFPQGYLSGMRDYLLREESIEEGRSELFIMLARLNYETDRGYFNFQETPSREAPLILTKKLNADGRAIIPNSRSEGGIERAFSAVQNKGGGLVGIAGGFDFLASLAANGFFQYVVGFDINPSQLLATSIRASLCELSPTPFHYLSNLLSLEIGEKTLDQDITLYQFLSQTEDIKPSKSRMEQTWSLLEGKLRYEEVPLQNFRKSWESFFDLYSQDRQKKTKCGDWRNNQQL